MTNLNTYTVIRLLKAVKIVNRPSQIGEGTQVTVTKVEGDTVTVYCKAISLPVKLQLKEGDYEIVTTEHKDTSLSDLVVGDAVKLPKDFIERLNDDYGLTEDTVCVVLYKENINHCYPVLVGFPKGNSLWLHRDTKVTLIG